KLGIGTSRLQSEAGAASNHRNSRSKKRENGFGVNTLRTSAVVAAILFAYPVTFGANPRERILLDADWRFHLGEIPGDNLVPIGTPILNWKWKADENGPSDAAKMAVSRLDP